MRLWVAISAFGPLTMRSMIFAWNGAVQTMAHVYSAAVLGGSDDRRPLCGAWNNVTQRLFSWIGDKMGLFYDVRFGGPVHTRTIGESV